MAVKLRLTRFGKKNQPMYRLVAIDESKKRDGKSIEVLGTYNPSQKDNQIEVKTERLKYWLSVGARPSDTVKNLLKIKI